MAKITFQNESSFEEGDASLTLLQMALKNGLPHIHACGGNGRCSTCRVMVHEGLEHCQPRNAVEQAMAGRKGMESNIRLACQTKVTGPVRLRRLVLDDADLEVAVAAGAITTGREAKLAILFSDVREFTRFSEKQLPYDVVHVINRYFRGMGEVILAHDGFIDKYVGDGLMALFGLNDPDGAKACRDAVSAGLAMIESLQDLNAYLQKNFGAQFGMGVGIHFGSAVIGNVGHPRRMQYTAIGDAVNTASRVESATKEAGVSLLVSGAVHQIIGPLLKTGAELEVSLKGKEGKHRLYEVIGLVPDPMERSTPQGAARAARRALRSVVTRRRAPQFLRLAYHDAMTFDRARGLGGANGSIRFADELARPENRGLSESAGALNFIKSSFPEVSWADLIALAGALAVSQCNGPEILVPVGRKDSERPSPEGLLPRRDMTIEQLKTRFLEMGLGSRDLVALSGAHTLGRVDGVPFTDNPFTFTNSYFKQLLKRRPDGKTHMLGTDRALLEDPDCQAMVEMYALDQETFFRDFAAAYRRMTIIGTSLNEAEVLA
ncbi:MAG: peroxidase family protein [Phycisphaerales bacterium]